MVFPRPVQGHDVFGALKRLGFRLLRPRKVLVEDLLFCAFVRLEGGLIALKTANIYLSNPGQKSESGFGLYADSFFGGLLPNVLLTAILLGLGTNRGP